MPYVRTWLFGEAKQIGAEMEVLHEYPCIEQKRGVFGVGLTVRSTEGPNSAKVRVLLRDRIHRQVRFRSKSESREKSTVI